MRHLSKLIGAVTATTALFISGCAEAEQPVDRAQETSVSVSSTTLPAGEGEDPTTKVDVNQDQIGAPPVNVDDNKLIDAKDCTTDGKREPNAKVDIGVDSAGINRDYFGYTNEHSQLILVEAKELIVQDDAVEDVNSDGRYCSSLAKVPGTEKKEYDKGHVIADSLGGASNAYNITPQDSTLNRHGDQAYMEKVLRDALREGLKVTDFVAEIHYPDTETQIPDHYTYHYKIDGRPVTDSFPNKSPEKD